jgi:hypothetical protein
MHTYEVHCMGGDWISAATHHPWAGASVQATLYITLFGSLGHTLSVHSGICCPVWGRKINTLIFSLVKRLAWIHTYANGQSWDLSSILHDNSERGLASLFIAQSAAEASCVSIAQEFLWPAVFQALSQTHWLRICILTRSPGYFCPH